MNYLSVCSGVEAATVAWHHMGWKPVGFSEIEKFPSQVLAHHYPSVTNFGDMTKYKEWDINDTVGLLVGGTPCQSFSVAGLRKGLEDPRGNLALTYVGILDKFRPKWFIWENVPGVLSSGGGRDFGSFLGAVAECGYGFAYRVLDAQYFGVPQRRRRVFVVGYLGDWRPPAEVLFESESLSGNPKPSRKTRQSVAGYVESSFGQYREDVIAGTTKASGGVLGGGSETFLAIPIHDQATRFGGTNIGKGNGFGIGNTKDPMPTLDTSSRHAVAISFNTNARPDEIKFLNEQSNTLTVSQNSGVACIGGQHPNAAIGEEICPTLTNSMGAGGGHVPIVGFDSYNLCETGNVNQTIKSPQGGVLESIGGVFNEMAVRRLTPVECERLQGFPDNYTNIKENCPDGSRYKAMGNSMAVPVMRWIGERINRLEHGSTR